MKITHLSTHDLTGGAGRAALRLHKSLLIAGHESTMLVQSRQSSDPGVVAFVPPVELPARARRLWRRYFLQRSWKQNCSGRAAGASYFSDDRSENGADALGQAGAYDVLNLHWISGFIDYVDFFGDLPAGTPLVWTLHDMNPFTGGCHHAATCGRLSKDCGACPQLGSENENDFSRQTWQRKQRSYGALRDRPFQIVTPSRWLAGKVKQSSLMGGLGLEVIPHSVDTEVFLPRDGRLARELFGIAPEARVILFVAHSLRDKYKGFPLLARALSRLRGISNLHLITVGEGRWEGGEAPPIPITSLGTVVDERLMALVYSASDLFLLPTLQDNFPNTALEALACGVPVVAFGVGGVPEIVREGQTGRVVAAEDSEGFARAVCNLFEDPAMLATMAKESRRVAVEEYPLEVQARRYAALYENLVGKK